jgi:anti-sigma factor RsiW
MTESLMQPDDIKEMIAKLLDGELTDADNQQLEQLIQEDEGARKAYLERLELHAMLAWKLHWSDSTALVAGTDTDSEDSRPKKVVLAPASIWRRPAIRWAIAASIAFIFVIGFLSIPDNTAAAALTRLIEASSQSGDRTYVLVADEAEWKVVETPGRKSPPPINGAVLHVRGDQMYVLIRTYADGRRMITGSNGKEAWSIRGDGPVRVSADPSRFRGAVPGEQQGLPFANIRANLEDLRTAYELTVLEPQALDSQSSRQFNRLQAIKRSQAHRGPRKVMIWHDTEAGVIHRMQFEGLPRAKGGPKNLTMTLTDQTELPNNWFEHTAHHEDDRRIIHDD